LEGSEHLFLDIDNLEQVLVPQEIIKDRANFLKEGVDVRALFYGDTVFSVELPQFLELLVVSVKDQGGGLVGGSKIASLETNAEVEVPMFIEVGDIIKVDTIQNLYIQRV
jgi:elongation factor P